MGHVRCVWQLQARARRVPHRGQDRSTGGNRRAGGSSGEAELGGVVKAASEALGLQGVAEDFGLALTISICTDSSAAVGICRRAGIGRVRHLAVGQLWVQELVRDGAVALYKVKGERNPADLLTKPLGRATLDGHLDHLRVRREAGRAASAPAA